MLHLQLFGRSTITLNNQPITDFASEKVVALLAYLVVEDGEHGRDKLATLLWGDMPEKRAKANLRMACYSIQQNIPDALQTTRKTIAFNRALPHQIDVQQFLQTDDGAADLYRGDFLADLLIDAPMFDDWLRLQRERLRLRALQLLTELLNAAMARGAWEQASRAARQLLTIEPWQEQAHRDLMHCLARMGQVNAALRQYQTCRQLLRDELGVAPSAKTTRLFERIRGLREEQPLRLPLPPTPLIGRSAEIAQLTALLNQRKSRLITITGLGGIGKTRLALAVAERQNGWYLNGIHFVALAPLATNALLPTLFDALGLSQTRGGDPIAQLRDYLRERELLIVLDNAEHISDVVADLLAKLLPDLPNVTWVVTSREALRLREEWLFGLEGLAEGATLFEQTARRVARDFVSDAALVAQICSLLEGLPLGIELAAALVQHQPLATIVEMVRTLSADLQSRYRNVPARQRSLLATFDYSWQLLSAEQRTLLAQLSIFRGTFSARAVRAVTQAETTTLAGLVAHSLVRDVGDQRYQLHPLILQLSAERLTDPNPTQRAHSHYYLHRLAAHQSDLKSEHAADTIALISANLPNIHSAWQTACDLDEMTWLADAATTVRLFYIRRGPFDDGLALLSAALPATIDNAAAATLHLQYGELRFEQAQFDETRAAAMRVLAYDDDNQAARLLITKTHIRQGDYARALAMLAQCQPSRTQQRMTSLTHRFLGRYEEAIASVQALLASGVETLREAATLHEQLGDMYSEQGEVALAKHHYDTAIAQFRQLADLQRVGDTQSRLAAMHSQRGEHRLALDYWQQIITTQQTMGDTFGVAVSHSLSGLQHKMLGEYDAAERELVAAIRFFERTDSQPLHSQSLTFLASVYICCGVYESADSLLTRALSIADARQSQFLTYLAQLYQVVSATEQGNGELAVRISAELHNAVEAMDAHAPRMNALRVTAFAHLANQQPAIALTLFDKIESPNVTVLCGRIAALLQSNQTEQLPPLLDQLLPLDLAAFVEQQELPFKHLWAVYRAMVACGDERSGEMFIEMRYLYYQRRDAIESPLLRTSFAENVTAHRAIEQSDDMQQSV